MKKVMLILICVSLLFACSSSPSNQNTATKPTPIPDKNTPKEAIETFLISKYPSWKMQGDTLDKDFIDDVQFDIHLRKDKEDKVITVILKKFQDVDGQYYWLLYEPTKLEIAKSRLEQLKQNAVDDWQETMASMSPPNDNEPSDPR